MHVIHLTKERGPWSAFLNTLKELQFSQMSATSSRGQLPHEAILCFMKVVLNVCWSTPASVSKWMHRRLPSHSQRYFLITCWWWLVARGRGLHCRPKDPKNAVPISTTMKYPPVASYIFRSDGSQGCLQDCSNDCMHFLVKHYKCTVTSAGLYVFTSTTMPAMCLAYLILLYSIKSKAFGMDCQS
jgi:hypothetical protein